MGAYCYKNAPMLASFNVVFFNLASEFSVVFYVLIFQLLNLTFQVQFILWRFKS
jgi:hypothetical protein